MTAPIWQKISVIELGLDTEARPLHNGNMNAADDDKEEQDESNSQEEETASSQKDPEPEGPMTLQRELEVNDLGRVMFFKDNKIFSAVGPQLPIVQLDKDGAFVSHAPDQPYREGVDEELTVVKDSYGRLMDPLGEVRKLTGMKYNGRQLYYIADRHPENGQHLAAWFDDEWKAHRLYLGESLLSAYMVLKVRYRMIDGELSAFPEISSD